MKTLQGVFFFFFFGYKTRHKHLSDIFVICRFLQRDKVNGPEGNNLFYELAERGLDRAVSEKIKEYVAEVMF